MQRHIDMWQNGPTATGDGAKQIPTKIHIKENKTINKREKKKKKEKVKELRIKHKCLPI